jgi:hypothetical protein
MYVCVCVCVYVCVCVCVCVYVCMCVYVNPHQILCFCLFNIFPYTICVFYTPIPHRSGISEALSVTGVVGQVRDMCVCVCVCVCVYV